MRKKFFLLIFLLISCSPASPKEYQYEGEDVCKSILKILQKIESVSDLNREGVRLKKEYAKLVKVMIEAKKFQLRHKEIELIAPSNFEVSQALKSEFIRIYEIEGCQEKMEALQRESLHKLHQYQRRTEGFKSETYQ
jgi:hypothetical protein